MHVIYTVPYKAFTDVCGWSAMSAQTLTRWRSMDGDMAMEFCARVNGGQRGYQNQPHGRYSLGKVGIKSCVFLMVLIDFVFQPQREIASPK
jgi:hypothetical protein